MENRTDAEGDVKLQEMKTIAAHHLDLAETLCDQYPDQTNAIAHGVSEVRRTLEEASYESEMRMVVTAMAGEVRGTGHWYTCENGHPFLVGECGMPMEQARCSACAAPIGGQDHQAVEGVQHANEIEERFGNMCS